MSVCPYCGSALVSESDACPRCERESEDAFTCSRCGIEAAGGDACPRCGALRAEHPCDEHPERSAARRCVICGRAVCDDCAAADREPALCAEHDAVPIVEGWAQVYSTASEMEARLLADNLRAEGIDSQVYAQNDRIFPVDLGELSIVRVLVPVWEYALALDVIRGHMDARGEVAFACAACGEATEPGAEQCVSCGATLDAPPTGRS